MRNPHDEKNSKPYYFNDFLKDIFNILKKTFRYLLGLNIEKKKAISLTFIIMTLSFFLGSRDVFLLNHILCISSDYYRFDGDMNNLSGYIPNYIIFLIMWSPAIYLLSLYWNSKNLKFHLSLAYAVGLLTYRFSHSEWGLYNFDNFVSCFGISVLFVCLAALMNHFVKRENE